METLCSRVLRDLENKSMTPKEATKLIVKEADVSLFSFLNLLSMGILASSMAGPMFAYLMTLVACLVYLPLAVIWAYSMATHYTCKWWRGRKIIAKS